MTRTSVEVRISLAWWWPCYVGTVIALCRLLDAEPNMDKVFYWAGKAVRIRLVDA